MRPAGGVSRRTDGRTWPRGRSRQDRHSQSPRPAQAAAASPDTLRLQRASHTDRIESNSLSDPIPWRRPPAPSFFASARTGPPSPARGRHPMWSGACACTPFRGAPLRCAAGQARLYVRMTAAGGSECLPAGNPLFACRSAMTARLPGGRPSPASQPGAQRPPLSPARARGGGWTARSGATPPARCTSPRRTARTSPARAPAAAPA